MKNTTVAVPKDIYRRARVKAAERDTSVSALVREFLIELGSDTSDFERRKKLQSKILAKITSFRAGDRESRDKIHERNALR